MAFEQVAFYPLRGNFAQCYFPNRLPLPFPGLGAAQQTPQAGLPGVANDDTLTMRQQQVIPKLDDKDSSHRDFARAG